MSILADTRRSLHGVAELLLAGPQYAASGTIELRAAAGGFATVAAPDLRVSEGRLVGPGIGEAIDGRTIEDIAASAGLEPRSLDDVYSGSPGVSSKETLVVDGSSARVLAQAFSVGDAALAAFAPEEHRVLWPEHFDIAVSVGEVNYGVSPGDAYLDVPYAYVGPWTPREGAFWDAPFGAARRLDELGGADQVRDFFEEGRRLVDPQSHA
jgi:hypothetical protein